MGTRRSFEPEPPAAADVDVEALIGRFGTNANSLFVRYPAAWRFFVGSSSEGAVPYLLVGRTVIAWADPLCSDAERADLLGEFLTAMRGLRRRVVFLAVGKLVARAAMDLRCSVINVGAEPTFDLSTWRVPAGDPGKHLRWALNHARRAGVIVEDFRPGARSSAPVEAEIAAVQRVWEERRAGKVVHSFLRTDPLKVSEGSRIFVARRGSHVEAFLACSPVPARDGWYLEDLVRLPNAPNGATELLVVEALHRLQQEGASYATLGIAPFRGAEQQIDRRARVVMPAVRWGLAHFDRRYRFASMSHYKAKFNATGWEPRFVAFSPAVPTLATVRAAISALDPPDPAPEHAPGRTPGERAVVGQASALVLASLLVLARSHLREDLWSTAGLLAPAGVAGLLTGVLLLVASFRMAHVAGRAAVTAAFGVELILVLGAGVRIHDGRFAPFELFVAAFAGASAILLLRSPPAAAGRPTPED